MSFVISREHYYLSNYNNILGSNIFIPRKLLSILNKYTNKILFVGGFSTWSVNEIYDGLPYEIIKYKKDLTSQK